MSLTKRQIKFCKLVSNGLSASEAYQKAYNNVNASTCKVNASKLLKHPAIASKIKELKDLNKQITNRAQQKALDNVAADFDIASIAERKDILTKIARGEIKLNKPMVCDKEIQLIEVVPDYMDRKNAIAELNKMDGSYAPAKVEHSGEIKTESDIDLSKYTDEDLKTLIELQSKGRVSQT